MARTPEKIEVGVHLLGENQESGVMVLFGGSNPGGLGDYDDLAEVGSVFITTDGHLHQKKVSNGNPADWERKADRAELYDIAELDALLAQKINYTDLVANIVTNDDNKPLSASQALVLTQNLNTAITNLKGGASVANDTLGKLETNLNAHSSRIDNPHMVSKAQIGLGNVENKSSATIRSEIVDADIPATITRDGELASAISVALSGIRDGVPADGDTLNKLNNKIVSILTTLQSDTTALDTLQEVVDFIEANRVDLDAVLTNKINYTDIVDNLLSTDGTTKTLSANQGRVLNGLIQLRLLASNNLSDLTNVASARTNLDVYSKGEVDTAIADATLTASEIKTLYESNLNTNAFTDLEKTKLAGIEDGATQNQTDAYLLNRLNHTGTQLASTISDFDTEVANNTEVTANSAHRVRTDNPHSVTKTQVGLGNVTNDAQLKILSNLSDVANPVTSRRNLGVYNEDRSYINIDTTTNLNADATPVLPTDPFATLVPIFGNIDHADDPDNYFAKVSDTRVLCNFTGAFFIRASGLLLADTNRTSVFLKYRINGITYTENIGKSEYTHNAGDNSYLWFIYDTHINVNNGDYVELLSARANDAGTIVMAGAGLANAFLRRDN